jgi:ribosome-associated protein
MLTAENLDVMRVAAQAALDKKAFQLVGLEVTELTSYADALLLCSAASDRQVAAVVDGVVASLKAAGRRPIHVEGDGRGGWVLVDYGDLIVHIFTEEKRAYYALEGLWGDAPTVAPDELGLGNAGFAERS